MSVSNNEGQRHSYNIRAIATHGGEQLPTTTIVDLIEKGESNDDIQKENQQKCTSLASSFLVDIQYDHDRTTGVWSLFPISEVVTSQKDDHLKAEGAQAWAALHSELQILATKDGRNDDDNNSQNNNSSNSLHPAIILECHCNYQRKELIINVINHMDKSLTEYDDELENVLSRILLQWTILQQQRQEVEQKEEELPPQEEEEWKFIMKNGKGDGEEIIDSHCDFTSIDGVRKLFQISNNSLEIVEMVDKNGETLGMVPRTMVHGLNLLHRGIGMFVCKSSPSTTLWLKEVIQNQKGGKGNIDNNTEEGAAVQFQHPFNELYVHRRTDTKRIFPSLYDMFVGGVSTANEDATLTARREVSEELGLTKALDEMNDNTLYGLSDPLFRCTVCTGYNRCVVTMFVYMMDCDTETILWQEEEVAWGDFVPYDTIQAAADLSIQRFANQNKWPGTYPPIQSEFNGVLPPPLAVNENEYKSTTNEDWATWDFVPDGLLVWEAWLHFLKNS